MSWNAPIVHTHVHPIRAPKKNSQRAAARRVFKSSFAGSSVSPSCLQFGREIWRIYQTSTPGPEGSRRDPSSYQQRDPAISTCSVSLRCQTCTISGSRRVKKNRTHSRPRRSYRRHIMIMHDFQLVGRSRQRETAYRGSTK